MYQKSLLFVAEQHPTAQLVCTVQLSKGVERFWRLAVVNRAAVNLSAQVPVEISVHFSEE